MSPNFSYKVPNFCHGLLHRLTKFYFSQNLTAKLFFSHLLLFLNVIRDCFFQKNWGLYFSSLFSLTKPTVCSRTLLYFLHICTYYRFSFFLFSFLIRGSYIKIWCLPCVLTFFANTVLFECWLSLALKKHPMPGKTVNPIRNTPILNLYYENYILSNHLTITFGLTSSMNTLHKSKGI